MSDYDFKPLNDKEFEMLCADLLGEVEGHKFERFKAGKDGGVDGRYFSSTGDEIILQCKHWGNTPLSQLLRALKTIEKPKLDKLKPHRYLLALSNSLSRENKKAIQASLDPYIRSESDIYGMEDLNDLLKKQTQVEQRHYKLWLHSTSVLGHIINHAILGRSAFSIEEIIRSSARYVVTENHAAALKTLEKYGVVIITGEPGVGKTTLADQLCLHYVANGYRYTKIADEIKDAESVFDSDSKQIFYFDDFLGRNYLDALRGHEASHVTQFIRRVAHNKNKRFILTSRSTILNQGKLLNDSFDHDNVQKNEYELRISSLTELDKAQILYNHIWHSGLSNDYIEQIYIDRRYRKVIEHRNFNPRLISYITDSTRLVEYSADEYWEYIVNSLINPSKIWEHPFIAQQDDFSRAIVLLVVLNGSSLSEDVLAEAYHRYISFSENHSLQGRREFQANIRQLTGSFLARSIVSTGAPVFDLFNPSIGDYVLNRYANDVTSLKLGILSLRTTQSLVTLKSLKANNKLSRLQAFSISKVLLNDLAESDFLGASSRHVALLCKLHTDWGDAESWLSDRLSDAARFILKICVENATVDAIDFLRWALNHEMLSAEQALEFSIANISDVIGDDEIKALFLLMDDIPESIPGRDEFVDSAIRHVVELMGDNFSEFIEVDIAFSRVDYGEVSAATRELERLIEKKLSDLGVPFSSSHARDLLDNYDVACELDKYFMNSYDGDDRDSSGPAVLAIDEIDDLFDRS